MTMDYEVIHHGESTIEISLGKSIDMKINLVVHSLFSFLTDNLDNRSDYIIDFYPTYHSIFIDFNELKTDFYHIKQKLITIYNPKLIIINEIFFSYPLDIFISKLFIQFVIIGICFIITSPPHNASIKLIL